MQAYIDPASTSYLAQIITGVVITLGVSLGIFSKRIRAFFTTRKVKRLEQQLKKQTAQEGLPAEPAPEADKQSAAEGFVEKDGVFEIQLDDPSTMEDSR